MFHSKQQLTFVKMGLCLAIQATFADDSLSENENDEEHGKEKLQELEAQKSGSAKQSERRHTNLGKDTKSTEKTKKGNNVTRKQIRKIGKAGNNKNMKKRSGKAGKRKMLNGVDSKWADWQASEEANKSERKVRKMRFLNGYELDDLRRGFIVYDQRRGLYPDQIEDIEDSYENAVKKERNARRIRRINESLSWSLN